MSPWARAVAVFVRPSQAWTGLESRVQWWIPWLVSLVISTLAFGLTYGPAYLPMTTEIIEQRAADQDLPSQQVDGILRFYESPVGAAVTVGTQAVFASAMTFLAALGIWLGIAFMLGRRFTYRLSLEVAAWSSLVALPGFLLTMVLAAVRHSLLGVHVGFGALLPEPETPTRLSAGLGNFLDAIGPLALWPVVVGILGASVLSGAPRRPTAWVLGTLYLVAVLLGAVLASFSVPAA
jgi:hypothetical protein